MNVYEVWVTGKESGTLERVIVKAADVTWNQNGPMFLWAQKWGNSDNNTPPNYAVAGFAEGQWARFRVIPQEEIEATKESEKAFVEMVGSTWGTYK